MHSRPYAYAYWIGTTSLLPSDSFMSDLYCQLGYSTREFQALQLITLAVFGAVDSARTSCMLVHFFEISIEWQLVCKLDIMKYIFFIVFNSLHAQAFAYILTFHDTIIPCFF